MKPISFKEQTKILNKPSGMTDQECAPLPVWTDGSQCVSCWEPTWRERLSILFTGRVWVFVFGSFTQPPIALAGKKTVFEPEKK